MPDPTLDRAYRFLRAHSTGELRFDEHVRPFRYVIEPGGRLVGSAMVAMLAALETVLFVPEYAEGCMEILTTLEAFKETGDHGALADRWRIYHGDPPDVRWAFLDIDTARFEDRVLDGDALMRPNPLAGVESSLIRWVNREHSEAFGRACRRLGGVDVEQPLLVGVDPLGFDVRRRFDIVRVEAPAPMASEADARRVLTEMFEAANA